MVDGLWHSVPGPIVLLASPALAEPTVRGHHNPPRLEDLHLRRMVLLSTQPYWILARDWTRFTQWLSLDFYCGEAVSIYALAH